MTIILGPAHQRRHGGQDRLDIAAGLQPENRTAIVEQVELHIASTADELLVPVGLRPRILLAVGAPSSPPLSNAVMYEFDSEVSDVCSRIGVVYTRYADDLTLSGNENDLLAVELEIDRIVLEMESPRLQLNSDKRGLYRRGMKQMVTGLVLTPQEQISMGRQRKRLLSAAIHRATLGKVSRKELSKIRGWLAFANSVEPKFIVRLKRKYGAPVVDGLLYGMESGLPPRVRRADPDD